MIDFIYHTTDLDDQVCGWIDALCREWGSSCFLPRNDKTQLWVRKDSGMRIKIKDFGNSFSEFKKIIKRSAR